MKHEHKPTYTCDIADCVNRIEEYGFTYDVLEPYHEENIRLDFIMMTERDNEVHICKDCQITIMKMHIANLETL